MVHETEQQKAATGVCNSSALLGNDTTGASSYFSYLDTVLQTGLCNEQGKNYLSLTRGAGEIHSKANEMLGVHDGNVFALQQHNASFLMRKWPWVCVQGSGESRDCAGVL